MGIPHGLVVNVLYYKIVVSKFKLQSCCFIHFQTNTPGERHEPPYPSPTMD